MPRSQKYQMGRGRTFLVRAAYEDGSPLGSLRDRVKTPLDAITLGPRIAMGGALDLLEVVSDPEILRDRMNELETFIQDPRSADEKASVVAKEVEFRLVSAADKGRAMEGMAVQSARAALQSSDTLPAELKENLIGLLPAESAAESAALPAPKGTGGARAPGPPKSKPVLKGDPKYSLAQRIEESRDKAAKKPADAPMSDAARAEFQAAAEVDRLKDEVAQLRVALSEYAAAKEEGTPGKLKMSALNLRERRDALSRSIRESNVTSASGSSPALSEAMQQAEELSQGVASLDI